LEDTINNSILIIDDEQMHQVFLSRILSSEYLIHVAEDGKTGLKLAKEVLPDLILLDIMMPGMNGYDVLAELKKTEETRTIPVIFITGLSSKEDEEKGLAFDAADYISKPFKAEIAKLRVRNQMKFVNQLRTIERLCITDQLTGIQNRRGFFNIGNKEWRRMIREKLPLSVLMLDVDKFKAYNDTYGHPQGDTALREVARVLTGSIERPGDFAARWGGEEFIVLLPDTDIDGALKVAERIRSGVENKIIPRTDGSSTKITVSIGVNTLIPAQDSLIDDFISRADKALYTAKATGRNKVCREA
jgi:diguanylate cyclase (GGDEF)-like protein